MTSSRNSAFDRVGDSQETKLLYPLDRPVIGSVRPTDRSAHSASLFSSAGTDSSAWSHHGPASARRIGDLVEGSAATASSAVGVG
jgi:hypothetical protein